MERKTLAACLEMQEEIVCKTRYRIGLEENKEGYNEMREWRWYSIRISDG